MNATDLKAGTRVTTSVGKYAGRTGTVNGVDAGEVTIPGHENFSRKYIGVSWDAIDGDMGSNRRSRPFVDELTIVENASETSESTWRAAQFDDFVVGDRVRFQTIDNGFGGSGDFIMREGTVTAVTARTLRVDCGPGPFGSRAVLTRANWYHRDPHKAAAR